MKLEVLISAVNADESFLIKKMNITSDAVLINQAGRNDAGEMSVKNGKVRVFSFNEKGVGQSRNRAIENARGDILLFSDDDIVYDSDYEEKVLKEFENHPEADGIFFNVEVNEKRRTYWNEGFKRVGFTNSGRYPAYSIAVRRDKLLETGVRFSLLFGGGAKYSCGEDSLFIKDLLAAGFEMYKTETKIGKEEERANSESTWFNGYNEKFFKDRGVLYAFLYGALAEAVAARFIYTKKDVMCNEIKPNAAMKLMLSGIKEGRKLKRQGANE